MYHLIYETHIVLIRLNLRNGQEACFQKITVNYLTNLVEQ